jgi:hypothetical protein
MTNAALSSPKRQTSCPWIIFFLVLADFWGGFFFSLYVRVAVLNSAQDCIWMGLLFGFATFFIVCFGVQLSFFCTPSTCFYVETAAMCMCRYIETAKKRTRILPKKG